MLTRFFPTSLKLAMETQFVYHIKKSHTDVKKIDKRSAAKKKINCTRFKVSLTGN